MNIKRANPKLVAEFKGIPTSILSDCLDRLPAIEGVRPMHKGGCVVGSALTVLTRSGDNKAIHEALGHIQKGDVIVVSGGGEMNRAVFGEIMATLAISRGAVGLVIDAAIRDLDFFMNQSEFACYAMGAMHRGPYKNGPGKVNIPITCGNWTVNPGDIVCGDYDGVVTFGEDIAEKLLAEAKAKVKWENEQIAAIKNGTYKNTYNG